MDQREALSDFLKNLRIVLNNAAAYPKSHPYFIKSVDNFKQKVDPIVAMQNPLKVNFGPDFITIGNNKWEKEAFFIDLASMLHVRKVKSIQIGQGVSVDAMANLLSAIAMPTRELLRAGGVGTVLKNANAEGIQVEEVDYSQLLSIDGEESKDVWVYLFGDVVDKHNQVKIDEFADNFDKIVRKFKSQELLQDSDLKKNLHGFLMYLKGHQKEKFHKCAGELFRSAIGTKDITEIGNLDQVKALFDDFSDDDFAGMLWDGVAGEGNFDLLSLQLFCRLTGEERHKNIASLLLNRAQEKGSVPDNAKIVKKIHDLLSLSSDKVISEVYRSTLSILLRDVSLSQGMTFDRALLRSNYRYVLLNMLDLEMDKVGLEVVCRRLDAELASVTEEGDFNYLGALLGVLRRRRGEGVVNRDVLLNMETQISGFIENIVWEGKVTPEVMQLIDLVKISSLKPEVYLDRMFLDNKISPYILALFLKFFPHAVSLFLDKLQAKYTDMDFLSRLIESLREVNNQVSLYVLESIASSANEFIKIEAIRAMAGISKINPEYLLSVLASGSVSLRKEALTVLIKNTTARQLALEQLLGIPSPWGSKNNQLLENMAIIQEVKVRDARDHLGHLAKRHFFWNANVRRKARKILKEWDA